MRFLFIFSTVIFCLFTVQPASAANVTIVTPNGGECLKAGSTQVIAWTMSGADHVALGYKTDGTSPAPYASSPSSYFTMTSNQSTSYGWTVPSVTSSTVKIYIDAHANDHSQVAFDSSDSNFAIDSSPPTSPKLTLTNHTATSATISWQESSDEGCAGLTGYKIYRDGSLITNVSATTTTFTDSSVVSGTVYSYTVIAYDDFHTTESTTVTNGDNPSTTTITPSPSAKVATTPALKGLASPATTIDFHNFKVTNISTDSARFVWTTPKKTIATIDYGLSPEYGQTKAEDTAGTKHSLKLTELELGKKYFYRIRLRDNDNKEGDTTSGSFSTLLATPKPTPGPINSPVMKSVLVDNQNIAINFDAPTQLTVGQIIRLKGLATPNTSVEIHVFSRERIYRIPTDSQGSWLVDINTKSYEPGDHRITLTATSKGGTIAPEKELFRFSLIKRTPHTTAEKIQQSKSFSWLIIVLTALILASVYTSYRRYHRRAQHPHAA